MEKTGKFLRRASTRRKATSVTYNKNVNRFPDGVGRAVANQIKTKRKRDPETDCDENYDLYDLQPDLCDIFDNPSFPVNESGKRSFSDYNDNWE